MNRDNDVQGGQKVPFSSEIEFTLETKTPSYQQESEVAIPNAVPAHFSITIENTACLKIFGCEDFPKLLRALYELYEFRSQFKIKSLPLKLNELNQSNYEESETEEKFSEYDSYVSALVKRHPYQYYNEKNRVDQIFVMIYLSRALGERAWVVKDYLLKMKLHLEEIIDETDLNQRNFDAFENLILNFDFKTKKQVPRAIKAQPVDKIIATSHNLQPEKQYRHPNPMHMHAHNQNNFIDENKAYIPNMHENINPFEPDFSQPPLFNPQHNPQLNPFSNFDSQSQPVTPFEDGEPNPFGAPSPPQEQERKNPFGSSVNSPKHSSPQPMFNQNNFNMRDTNPFDRSEVHESTTTPFDTSPSNNTIPVSAVQIPSTPRGVAIEPSYLQKNQPITPAHVSGSLNHGSFQFPNQAQADYTSNQTQFPENQNSYATHSMVGQAARGSIVGTPEGITAPYFQQEGEQSNSLNGAHNMSYNDQNQVHEPASPEYRTHPENQGQTVDGERNDGSFQSAEEMDEKTEENYASNFRDTTFMDQGVTNNYSTRPSIVATHNNETMVEDAKNNTLYQEKIAKQKEEDDKAIVEANSANADFQYFLKEYSKPFWSYKTHDDDRQHTVYYLLNSSLKAKVSIYQLLEELLIIQRGYGHKFYTISQYAASQWLVETIVENKSYSEKDVLIFLDVLYLIKNTQSLNRDLFYCLNKYSIELFLYRLPTLFSSNKISPATFNTLYQRYNSRDYNYYLLFKVILFQAIANCPNEYNKSDRSNDILSKYKVEYIVESVLNMDKKLNYHVATMICFQQLVKVAVAVVDSYDPWNMKAFFKKQVSKLLEEKRDDKLQMILILSDYKSLFEDEFNTYFNKILKKITDPNNWQKFKGLFTKSATKTAIKNTFSNTEEVICGMIENPKESMYFELLRTLKSSDNAIEFFFEIKNSCIDTIIRKLESRDLNQETFLKLTENENSFKEFIRSLSQLADTKLEPDAIWRSFSNFKNNLEKIKKFRDSIEQMSGVISNTFVQEVKSMFSKPGMKEKYKLYGLIDENKVLSKIELFKVNPLLRKKLAEQIKSALSHYTYDFHREATIITTAMKSVIDRITKISNSLKSKVDANEFDQVREFCGSEIQISEFLNSIQSLIEDSKSFDKEKVLEMIALYNLAKDMTEAVEIENEIFTSLNSKYKLSLQRPDFNKLQAEYQADRAIHPSSLSNLSEHIKSFATEFMNSRKTLKDLSNVVEKIAPFASSNAALFEKMINNCLDDNQESQGESRIETIQQIERMIHTIDKIISDSSRKSSSTLTINQLLTKLKQSKFDPAKLKNDVLIKAVLELHNSMINSEGRLSSLSEQIITGKATCHFKFDNMSRRYTLEYHINGNVYQLSALRDLSIRLENITKYDGKMKESTETVNELIRLSESILANLQLAADKGSFTNLDFLSLVQNSAKADNKDLTIKMSDMAEWNATNAQKEESMTESIQIENNEQKRPKRSSTLAKIESVLEKVLKEELKIESECAKDQQKSWILRLYGQRKEAFAKYVISKGQKGTSEWDAKTSLEYLFGADQMNSFIRINKNFDKVEHKVTTTETLSQLRLTENKITEKREASGRKIWYGSYNNNKYITLLTFIIKRDLVNKGLRPINFIFLNHMTLKPELNSFISSAFSDQEKDRYYFLMDVHLLTNEMKDYMIDSIKRYLDDKTQEPNENVVAFMNENASNKVYNEFGKYTNFEAIKSNQLDYSTIQSDETSRELMKDYVTRCRTKVVSSRLAGLGKTHFIESEAKSKDLEVMSIYLSGEVTTASIHKRIELVSDKVKQRRSNQVLHIKLDMMERMVDNCQIVDQLIFKIMFLKCLQYEGGYLFFDKIETIYLEVGNNYKAVIEKDMSSVSLLVMMQSDKKLNMQPEQLVKKIEQIEWSRPGEFDFTCRSLEFAHQVAVFYDLCISNVYKSKNYAALTEAEKQTKREQVRPKIVSHLKALFEYRLQGQSPVNAINGTWTQLSTLIYILNNQFTMMEKISALDPNIIEDKATCERSRKTLSDYIMGLSSNFVWSNIQKMREESQGTKQIRDQISGNNAAEVLKQYRENMLKVGGWEDQQTHGVIFSGDAMKVFYKSPSDISNEIKELVKSNFDEVKDHRNLQGQEMLNFFMTQIVQAFNILPTDSYIDKLLPGVRAANANDPKLNELHQKLKAKDGIVKYLLEEASNFDGKKGFVLNQDNYLKTVIIVQRSQVKVPIVIIGETGCGKTYLIRFIVQIILRHIFIEVTLHNGYSEDELEEVICNSIQLANRNPNNKVWIFFDEFNTSPLQSLIEEIMCSRRCTFSKRIKSLCPQGSVPENMQFVAACNPWRIKAVHSTAGLIHESAQNAFSHNVYPIPESLLNYAWSFGQLSEQTELDYIKGKIESSEEIKKLNLSVEMIHSIQRSIAISQSYVRKEETDSSVSLRDLERFEKILCFLNEFLKPLGDIRVAGDAFICTLFICYFLRIGDYKRRRQLDEELASELTRETFKKEYADAIFSQNKNSISIIGRFNRTSEKIITDAQEKLGINFGEDIFINKPIKENIFTLIVAICTKIPIMICGKPGTSKTLSTMLVAKIFECQNKNQSTFFKNIGTASFETFSGSQLTTSNDVKTFFQKCENLADQSKRNEATKNRTTVLLFDELGLAEIGYDNPLKVLHPLLEPKKRKIAFIGISNWRLDLSKMSRALFVSRPDLEKEELKEIFENAKLTDEQRNEFSKHLQAISVAYNRLIENELGDEKRTVLNTMDDDDIVKNRYSNRYHHPNFFGLRDYYHIIKFIKRNYESFMNCETDSKLVYEEKLQVFCFNAIERNFSGKQSRFYNQKGVSGLYRSSEVFKYFYLEACGQRNPPKDKFTKKTSTMAELISQNLIDVGSRHLMVFTDNPSVTETVIKSIKKFLFQFPEKYDESKVHECIKAHDIEDIRTLVQKLPNIISRGHVLILKDTDELYSCLYEVLNQRYVEVKDRSCYLHFGTDKAESVNIHDNFRVIVLMDRVDSLQSTREQRQPAPFLNRFEKVLVVYDDIANEFDRLVFDRIEETYKEVKKNKKNMDFNSMVFNYSEDQVNSLIIQDGSADMNFNILSKDSYFKTIVNNWTKENAQTKAIDDKDIQDKVNQVIARMIQLYSKNMLLHHSIETLGISENIISIFKETHKFDTAESLLGSICNGSYQPDDRGVAIFTFGSPNELTEMIEKSTTLSQDCFIRSYSDFATVRLKDMKNTLQAHVKSKCFIMTFQSRAEWGNMFQIRNLIDQLDMNKGHKVVLIGHFCYRDLHDVNLNALTSITFESKGWSMVVIDQLVRSNYDWFIDAITRPFAQVLETTIVDLNDTEPLPKSMKKYFVELLANIIEEKENHKYPNYITTYLKEEYRFAQIIYKKLLKENKESTSFVNKLITYEPPTYNDKKPVDPFKQNPDSLDVFKSIHIKEIVKGPIMKVLDDIWDKMNVDFFEKLRFLPEKEQEKFIEKWIDRVNDFTLLSNEYLVDLIKTIKEKLTNIDLSVDSYMFSKEIESKKSLEELSRSETAQEDEIKEKRQNLKDNIKQIAKEIEKKVQDSIKLNDTDQSTIPTGELLILSLIALNKILKKSKINEVTTDNSIMLLFRMVLMYVKEFASEETNPFFEHMDSVVQVELLVGLMLTLYFVYRDDLMIIPRDEILKDQNLEAILSDFTETGTLEIRSYLLGRLNSKETPIDRRSLSDRIVELDRNVRTFQTMPDSDIKKEYEGLIESKKQYLEALKLIERCPQRGTKDKLMENVNKLINDQIRSSSSSALASEVAKTLVQEAKQHKVSKEDIKNYMGETLKLIKKDTSMPEETKKDLLNNYIEFIQVYYPPEVHILSTFSECVADCIQFDENEKVISSEASNIVKNIDAVLSKNNQRGQDGQNLTLSDEDIKFKRIMNRNMINCFAMRYLNDNKESPKMLSISPKQAILELSELINNSNFNPTIDPEKLKRVASAYYYTWVLCEDIENKKFRNNEVANNYKQIEDALTDSDPKTKLARMILLREISRACSRNKTVLENLGLSKLASAISCEDDNRNLMKMPVSSQQIKLDQTDKGSMIRRVFNSITESKRIENDTKSTSELIDEVASLWNDSGNKDDKVYKHLMLGLANMAYSLEGKEFIFKNKNTFNSIIPENSPVEYSKNIEIQIINELLRCLFYIKSNNSKYCDEYIKKASQILLNSKDMNRTMVNISTCIDRLVAENTGAKKSKEENADVLRQLVERIFNTDEEYITILRSNMNNLFSKDKCQDLVSADMVPIESLPTDTYDKIEPYLPPWVPNLSDLNGLMSKFKGTPKQIQLCAIQDLLYFADSINLVKDSLTAFSKLQSQLKRTIGFTISKEDARKISISQLQEHDLQAKYNLNSDAVAKLLEEFKIFSNSWTEMIKYHSEFLSTLFNCDKKNKAFEKVQDPNDKENKKYLKEVKDRDELISSLASDTTKIDSLVIGVVKDSSTDKLDIRNLIKYLLEYYNSFLSMDSIRDTFNSINPDEKTPFAKVTRENMVNLEGIKQNKLLSKVLSKDNKGEVKFEPESELKVLKDKNLNLVNYNISNECLVYYKNSTVKPLSSLMQLKFNNCEQDLTEYSEYERFSNLLRKEYSDADQLRSIVTHMSHKLLDWEDTRAIKPDMKLTEYLKDSCREYPGFDTVKGTYFTLFFNCLLARIFDIENQAKPKIRLDKESRDLGVIKLSEKIPRDEAKVIDFIHKLEITLDYWKSIYINFYGDKVNQVKDKISGTVILKDELNNSIVLDSILHSISAIASNKDRISKESKQWSDLLVSKYFGAMIQVSSEFLEQYREGKIKREVLVDNRRNEVREETMEE